MESLTPVETALLLVGCVVPSLLVSCLTVSLIRRWAPVLGLVDHPGERKVHERVVPLGGGIGIWLGFVSPFVIGTIAVWVARENPELQSRLPEWIVAHLDGVFARLWSLWSILAGGSLLMLIGLCDDRYPLGWKIRLGVQFLVAAYFVYGQGWGLTAYIGYRFITDALTVIWIVAMINAFNMLDNMDALSGGIGAITSGLLGAVMLLNHEIGSAQPQLFVAGLVLVLLGSILGFLLHNRPPAKIFMGDAGSYLIGFTLSIATLLGTYADGRHSSLAVLTPLFLMAVPMYDMATVIWIRIKRGKSPFEADKNHLSHRLVELGFSRPQAVATIYLLTGTCGLGALLLHRLDWTGGVIVSLMVLCVLALIAILETTARRRVRSTQVLPGAGESSGATSSVPESKRTSK